MNSAAKSIFGKALAIDAAQERAAYLENACGGDAALRGEVESLLAAFDNAGQFLVEQPNATGEAPTTESYQSSSLTTQAPPVDEGAESRIGQYKLLQK